VWANVAAVVMLLAYLWIACRQAMHHPLWMDEVMTLWVIRMPGVAAIYHALTLGGQYEPPGHPVLLYVWAKIAGYSYLAMRLPSIVALLVAALAMFALVRRYLSYGVAVAALILTFCPPLFQYALQARPYALTVACFALALLLWDDLQRSPRSLWRLGGIVLLLSAAIALHFYCTLYLVSFGLIELLYECYARRWRPQVWVALLLAGASVAFWLPLARQISRINHADQGPQYYAAPTLARFEQLLHTIPFSRPCMVVVLVALVVLLVTFWMPGAWSGRAVVCEQLRDAAPLVIVALGCVALPLFTFAFAHLVTGTYNDRYVLPRTFGSILLVCLLLEWLPYKAWLAPAIALVVGLISIHNVREWGYSQPLGEVFARADKPYPVVMAEGLMFFQAEESPELTADQKRRIVYLTLPAGYPFADSTNENQVKLWQGINRALPIYSVQTYLGGEPCFYVYDSHASEDDLVEYLRQQGTGLQVTASIGRGTLSEHCSGGIHLQAQ
jgi:hypothetical protein